MEDSYSAAGQDRAWVHADAQLMPSAGVTYGVRYVGAMPVLIPIKTVDYDTRTKIARECIHRVCEDVGLKMPSRRHVDKFINKQLGATPDRQNAMSSATIGITTEAVTLVSYEDNVLIGHHNLLSVSFASGGDAELADFVSYVAKDDQRGRLCFVIECPGGLARDIITTFGQAFQLRYKQVVANSGGPVSDGVAGGSAGTLSSGSLAPEGCEHVIRRPSIPLPVIPLQQQRGGTGAVMPLQHHSSFENSNSADSGSAPLCTPAMAPPPYPPAGARRDVALPPIPSRTVDQPEQTVGTPGVAGDRAPMLPPRYPPGSSEPLEPTGEPWFLGPISRNQAEAMLKYDGDFLVRSSCQQSGQYVLSGRKDGKCKHLLLVDPDGKVRTRDRVFDSIKHLINYHVQYRAPIRSMDSELQLTYPVTTTDVYEMTS